MTGVPANVPPVPENIDVNAFFSVAPVPSLGILKGIV
jgi:hypothetical protein